MPLLKPFRALRYDPAAAGGLDSLVAPPYDIIGPEELAQFVDRSPYNVVRLIRPYEPELAAKRLHEWQDAGILVREDRPAVWLLEEEYVGPDRVPRRRLALVARVRVEPYGSGRVLRHERTFDASREARLRLLRATRTKLSPILLLHEGEVPQPDSARPPDVEAVLGGHRSCLWRIDDPAEIEAAVAAVRDPLIIADGHHRYEAALRLHEEEGTEETAHVLAAAVSRSDPGLRIFPTHRVVGGSTPMLNGSLRQTDLDGDADGAVERLESVPRDRSAFVLVLPDRAVLVESPARGGLLDTLDTALVAELGLDGVSFTPIAAEAADAVASGQAAAALLVRAPTLEQVEAFAVAGETMPEKSTYFYPKLTSGLLFSPLDE